MLKKSVQRRMITAAMAVIGIVLLAGSVLYARNDFLNSRASLKNNTVTLAEIFGLMCRSALEFDDDSFATEAFTKLAVEPNITAAALYREDGSRMAEYRAPGSNVEVLPDRPKAPGAHFGKGDLSVFQPIKRDNVQLGTIYLHLDLRKLYARLRHVLATVAVIFLGVASFGFLIERLNSELIRVEEHKLALQATNDRLIASEKKAMEATRTKSAFLANMSHELRTPLNAILGYSEMVKEEAQDLGQETLVPDLDKINAAGRHLLALINDILDLSKVEAGKMTLFVEEFDITRMVHEVVATIQPLIVKNDNRLEVNCPPGIGSMIGDQIKLRQALFNLLSNAAKFTENGIVTLRVSDDGEQPRVEGKPGSFIRFEVSDTGIGMSEDQMAKLFQAFSQADASTTRKYGGTGLGLAISRKFCELMGGNISVQSIPGKGSNFCITIPRRAASPSDQPAGADSPDAEMQGGPLVLVIDDETAARELIQRSLLKAGYRVHLARSGAEGIEAARELRPAVITLDVMMPQIDGWAVLGVLKSDVATREIPVLMVTVVDEKHLGMTLGATDYLTKPIDFQRLTALIRDHAERERSHVLVVEDDDRTREILRRTMEKTGWTVTEASNGRTALKMIGQKQPNLILLDLMMPEMDGFEFMRELRQSSSWQGIPVIVITAKDLNSDDRRRLNGEVAQILKKGSYSIQDLHQEIQKVLAARRRDPVASV